MESFLFKPMPAPMVKIEIDDLSDTDCAITSLDSLSRVDCWDDEIRKKLSKYAVCQSERLFEDILQDYLRLLNHQVERIKERQPFIDKIVNHAKFFYSFYQEMQEAAWERCNYLEYMEKIMLIYFNLEMDVVRHIKRREYSRFEYIMLIKQTAQRLCTVLSVFMLHDLKHILHVLLKVNKQILEVQPWKDVMNTVYSHFLVMLPVEDYSSETFCRNFLLYERWKEIRKLEDHADMDKTLYLRCRHTPETIKSDKTISKILMPSTLESVTDIAALLLEGRETTIKSYFKHIENEKKKSTDEPFILSNLNFDSGEESEFDKLNCTEDECTKLFNDIVKDYTHIKTQGFVSNRKSRTERRSLSSNDCIALSPKNECIVIDDDDSDKGGDISNESDEDVVVTGDNTTSSVVYILSGSDSDCEMIYKEKTSINKKKKRSRRSRDKPISKPLPTSFLDSIPDRLSKETSSLKDSQSNKLPLTKSNLNLTVSSAKSTDNTSKNNQLHVILSDDDSDTVQILENEQASPNKSDPKSSSHRKIIDFYRLLFESDANTISDDCTRVCSDKSETSKEMTLSRPCSVDLENKIDNNSQKDVFKHNSNDRVNIKDRPDSFCSMDTESLVSCDDILDNETSIVNDEIGVNDSDLCNMEVEICDRLLEIPSSVLSRQQTDTQTITASNSNLHVLTEIRNSDPELCKDKDTNSCEKSVSTQTIVDNEKPNDKRESSSITQKVQQHCNCCCKSKICAPPTTDTQDKNDRIVRSVEIQTEDLENVSDKCTYAYGLITPPSDQLADISSSPSTENVCVYADIPTTDKEVLSPEEIQVEMEDVCIQAKDMEENVLNNRSDNAFQRNDPPVTLLLCDNSKNNSHKATNVDSSEQSNIIDETSAKDASEGTEITEKTVTAVSSKDGEIIRKKMAADSNKGTENIEKSTSAVLSKDREMIEEKTTTDSSKQTKIIRKAVDVELSKGGVEIIGEKMAADSSERREIIGRTIDSNIKERTEIVNNQNADVTISKSNNTNSMEDINENTMKSIEMDNIAGSEGMEDENPNSEAINVDELIVFKDKTRNNLFSDTTTTNKENLQDVTYSFCPEERGNADIQSEDVNVEGQIFFLQLNDLLQTNQNFNGNLCQIIFNNVSNNQLTKTAENESLLFEDTSGQKFYISIANASENEAPADNLINSQEEDQVILNSSNDLLDDTSACRITDVRANFDGFSEIEVTDTTLVDSNIPLSHEEEIDLPNENSSKQEIAVETEKHSNKQESETKSSNESKNKKDNQVDANNSLTILNSEKPIENSKPEKIIFTSTESIKLTDFDKFEKNMQSKMNELSTQNDDDMWQAAFSGPVTKLNSISADTGFFSSGSCDEILNMETTKKVVSKECSENMLKETKNKSEKLDKSSSPVLNSPTYENIDTTEFETYIQEGKKVFYERKNNFKSYERVKKELPSIVIQLDKSKISSSLLQQTTVDTKKELLDDISKTSTTLQDNTFTNNTKGLKSSLKRKRDNGVCSPNKRRVTFDPAITKEENSTDSEKETGKMKSSNVQEDKKTITKKQVQVDLQKVDLGKMIPKMYAPKIKKEEKETGINLYDKYSSKIKTENFKGFENENFKGFQNVKDSTDDSLNKTLYYKNQIQNANFDSTAFSFNKKTNEIFKTASIPKVASNLTLNWVKRKNLTAYRRQQIALASTLKYFNKNKYWDDPKLLELVPEIPLPIQSERELLKRWYSSVHGNKEKWKVFEHGRKEKWKVFEQYIQGCNKKSCIQERVIYDKASNSAEVKVYKTDGSGPSSRTAPAPSNMKSTGYSSSLTYTTGLHRRYAPQLENKRTNGDLLEKDAAPKKKRGRKKKNPEPSNQESQRRTNASARRMNCSSERTHNTSTNNVDSLVSSNLYYNKPFRPNLNFSNLS